MSKHLSNVSKGLHLEDAITITLDMLKDGGRVIENYRLLNSHDYPDFYVLDAKKREWLLECKNLAVKKFESGDTWLHNINWVNKNILNKKWKERSYELYGTQHYDRERKSRVNDRITIRSNGPIPLLVISHFYFDTNAYGALIDFFGSDHIILTGEQIIPPSPWIMHVFGELRRVFTTD